jgi:hypothetical protein
MKPKFHYTPLPAERVPDNWRELHSCKAVLAMEVEQTGRQLMTLDDQGRCNFCVQNAPDGPLGKHGLDIIPFDVPGVYNLEDLNKPDGPLIVRKRKLLS